MASLGGTILGLSTCAYLALVGKVSGCSGTLRGPYLQLTCQTNSNAYHIVYLGGLMLGGAIMQYCYPQGYEDGGYRADLMIFSGILVGIGTTLGHGCTSGHGLCGLARWSKRSLVAVCSFFMTGVVVASALYPALKSEWEPQSPPSATAPHVSLLYAVFGVSFVFISYGAYILKELAIIASILLCSLAFAIGLVLSGMVKPTKVHGFLAINKNWDPSLLFVFFSGLTVNLILWPFIMKKARPAACPAFDLPQATEIKAELVYGGVIFGLGWALGGVCPGPSIVGLSGEYGMSMLIWMGGFFIGAQVAVVVQKNWLLRGSKSGTEEDAMQSVRHTDVIVDCDDDAKDNHETKSLGAGSPPVEHSPAMLKKIATVCADEPNASANPLDIGVSHGGVGKGHNPVVD